MKIRKGKLGIGLQVGMLTVSFDPSDINLGDETDDEAFPTAAESGMAVDLGLGHRVCGRCGGSESQNHI